MRVVLWDAELQKLLHDWRGEVTHECVQWLELVEMRHEEQRRLRKDSSTLDNVVFGEQPETFAGGLLHLVGAWLQVSKSLVYDSGDCLGT